MNSKKAKQIKKAIISPENKNNPIFRRMYRRHKKLYARTPEQQKPVLLKAIQEKFNYER
jgi:hypothetical protein